MIFFHNQAALMCGVIVCLSGIRHQQGGEAGHRPCLLPAADAQDPDGPPEDPRGRVGEQAAPSVSLQGRPGPEDCRFCRGENTSVACL